MDIFVARQPIFNKKQALYAYELLYRENEQNFFSGNVTSDVATSILLMNSYLNFGISHLVGEHRAFVNFGKELIMNDTPLLLNKDNVVIELLEDIIPDDAFLAKVKELKEKGYTIAIDDYVESYEYDALVNMADIIKVEFLGESRASIAKIAATWKPRGKILLAEKVETREEFQWALSIGFDLFQGYFFSKPSMVKSNAAQETSTQYIRLMNDLNVSEPDYKKITKTIETDPGTTYKLLKLVNSRFAKKNTIGTVHHALSMLGVNALRKWISLAMVQNISTAETCELVVTSMVRAQLLESIALDSTLKPVAQELTLMGILSILDVMLKKPMDELLSDLPVNENIRKTLLGESSPYAPAFKLCLDYEKGDFDNIASASEAIGYNPSHLPSHYVEAVKWADLTYKQMLDT